MTTTTLPTAPAVVLHESCTWDSNARRKPLLRSGDRIRFTEIGGRYFKVSADTPAAPWWVEEVNADGSLKGGPGKDADGRMCWTGGFTEITMTLAEARTVIAAEVAR